MVVGSEPRDVLGLVLAGGQSRRMGGQDKALLTLAGRPMMAHVVDRLRPQVTGLVISSNREAGDFEVFGAPVVPDAAAGFQGPLAGLAAAMRFARENLGQVSHILSLSTDTPFVPRTLAEDLREAIASGAAAAVAQTGDNVHWTVGCWPVEGFETIAAALHSGERKAQRVLETFGPRVVSFADVKMGRDALDPFFNVNTPDELAYAEAALARRGLPVIGIAGWKGAGKTTLTCRLIEALSARGLRVGSIKHSHHAAPVRGPFTDTARHAAAGAVKVAFVSPARWGIEPDVGAAPEPSLATVIAALGDVDVVLVEGMKGAPIPKIEVRSGAPTVERPPLREQVVAIADDGGDPTLEVPVFRRDDIVGLTRFLLGEFGL